MNKILKWTLMGAGAIVGTIVVIKVGSVLLGGAAIAATVEAVKEGVKA